MRAFREDGPWASDDVIVTNRYGLRSALAIAQPTGQFLVTNSWDGAGRWSVVGGTPGTFTYNYAPNSASSLPVSLSLPGGGYITNQYDALARLTRTELRTSGGSILNAYGYQYNLTHQRTLIGRTNSALSSYNGYVLAEYDAAGQLIKAWTYKPDGTPLTSQTWSYGYDAAQNLNKRTNNTTVETFTVNVLNQLTSIPDSTPVYDRRGNLISRTFTDSRSWTYGYDHENRLTSLQTDTTYTPEGSRFRVEFVYDGQGRMRLRRNYIWNSGLGDWVLSEEVRYLYDGLLIVQERNSSNTPTVTYTRGRDLSGTVDGAGGIGGLLARSYGYSGGSWTYHNYYYADGNGNVTALVNSSGTLQASYIYDPYGRYLTGTGSLLTANVMRFSSKPWVSFLSSSTTSGLYYYGYRFYDPYLQRWLNRDPVAEYGFTAIARPARIFVPGTVVCYGFNRNDPINAIDPAGLWQLGWPPWGKKKNKKCKDCEPEDPGWSFVKDQLKEGLIEIANADERASKFVPFVKTVLFAVDAAQRICTAFDPTDCVNLTAPDGSGLNYDNCLGCCLQILSLFGAETAGFQHNCAVICDDFPN